MHVLSLSTSTRASALAIGLAVAAVSWPASARADAPTLLYHRFETREAGQWVDVTLPLQPGAWRLGSEDGPTANAEQLKAALATARGLAIGARCHGTTRDSTHYPCKVEVSKPVWQPERQVESQGDITEWQANAGGTLWHFDWGGIAATSWPGEVVGPISSVATGSKRDLVSLLAPTRFMASSRLREAVGLQFRLRFTLSPLGDAPAGLRPEGWVILSTAPFQIPAASPLPSSDHRRPALGQTI